MSIEHWLGDPSAGVIKGVRPAQIRMAKIIESVLHDGGIAMIEAGTGTGKSLAALVPAIESGKRIIISTAKKALQRQMRDIDLPRLHQRMPSFSSATLKGKSNYACQLRFDEFKERGASRYPLKVLNDFSQWLHSDPTGEFADYETSVEFEGAVRVTECVSRQCRHATGCGYRKAKSLAEDAKIIVVNHALLAYDIALGGGGKVLGQYDALIIDEAHQAAQYFREALTCRIDTQQPEQLTRLLADTDIVVPPELLPAVTDFIAKLPRQGIVGKDDATVGRALRVQRFLFELKEQFRREGVWSQITEEAGEGTRSAKDLNRFRAAAVLTQRMLRACEVCVDKLDTEFDENQQEIVTPDSYVPYVTQKPFRDTTLKEFVVAPVEVGPFVSKALKSLHGVVFTSATLATSNNFNFLCREMGLKAEEVAYKEILPHAFNYRRNSCLYITSSVPEYKRDTASQFWRVANAEMDDLLTASKGGAFILCASNADVALVYDTLMAYGDRPYRLRVQDGNIDALVAWFKMDPTSVAVGTKSLWEGVDVPGLGLRLVIIPRLPFPPPDDPVFQRKKQRYVERSMAKGNTANAAEVNAWRLYDLQTAMIDLKQGAGRLIRHETDKGVVAVLDRRMYGSTKGYSGELRQSLPHPPSHDLAGVCALLTTLGNFACKK
jgi:ATP-dependent DNA helicase DinG